MSTMNLQNFATLTNELPKQVKRMPVLFTSHGNPMDIPMTNEQRPFWKKLYDLGLDLQKNYEVKAAVVISAHWCTGNTTYVNTSSIQKQIFDYYGFPKEYYEVFYKANGSPEVAKEIANLILKLNKLTNGD